MLEERRLLDGWKRIETRWTRIRGNERRASTLTLRLYSGAELESLLRSAGFREVSLYGSLDATALRSKCAAADRSRDEVTLGDYQKRTRPVSMWTKPLFG